MQTKLWPVFICYRQIDALTTAEKLFGILNKWRTKDARSRDIELDLFFDRNMPGVADWRDLHRPYLERARALIVICSPGAKTNHGDDDWVHWEIDWWLENRKQAPILIDPVLGGARYVPDQIAKEYPEIQRIAFLEKEWHGLTGQELEEKTAGLRNQVIGAIIPSGAEIYRQELEKEKQTARRLRRRLILTLVLLLTSSLLGAFAYQQQQEATLNERMSNAAFLDASAAQLLTRASQFDLIAGQETTRLRNLNLLMSTQKRAGARQHNLEYEIGRSSEEIKTLTRQRNHSIRAGRQLL